MGEFGEVLGRWLAYALSRTLAKSQFAQKYEWHIIAFGGVLLCGGVIFEAYKGRSTTTSSDIAATKPIPKTIPPPTQPPPPELIEERRSDIERAGVNIGRMLNRVRARFGILSSPHLRVPLVISILGLFVAAFGSVRYDFFVLLRVLLFCTCIITTVGIWKPNPGTPWLWTLAILSVLYNPLLPIHLHRDTWQLLNLTTIPVLGFLCFVLLPHRPANARNHV